MCVYDGGQLFRPFTFLFLFFLVMRVVYTTAVSFSVRCLIYPGFIGFTRVGTDFCRSDFAFAYEVHF